jgi:signal peptidase I
MSAAPAKKPAPRDPVREACETVVFVVALVLLLKLFAVEAFVIPTGSMAETLYGYQKDVTCPDCGHQYPVNCSNEVDPPDGRPRPVVRATCPNCRFPAAWKPGDGPGWRSGDRVLVHKAMYTVDGGPTRGDVVVFKYPVDPQINHTAQNYIKRLWGLGGETLAICRGDLYATTSLAYPPDQLDLDGRTPVYPRPADPTTAWEGPALGFGSSRVNPPFQAGGLDFTYHNRPDPLAAFAAARRAGFPAGGFEPLRKTPAQAVAMRRLVYDNDHPSATLAKRKVPPRWQADGPGWTTADDKAFTHTGGGLSFLRYRHRVPGPAGDALGGRPPADDWSRSEGGYYDGLFPPQPITNFLGYNAGVEAGQFGLEGRPGVGDLWAGDLMLEATAETAGGTVVLELSRGLHRYRATFANGEVALSRTAGDGWKELARRPSGFTAGSRRLAFANIDARLRVWVGDRPLDFGAEADYPAAAGFAEEAVPGALAGGVFAVRSDGHTLQNDIAGPASVGADGGATVSRLKLWADTVFTPAGNGTYDNPDDPVDTFYVQPGHYLCLGDNSGQSSDSRKWGLVPERLMLGKACVVFFPPGRVGFIR